MPQSFLDQDYFLNLSFLYQDLSVEALEAFWPPFKWFVWFLSNSCHSVWRIHKTRIPKNYQFNSNTKYLYTFQVPRKTILTNLNWWSACPVPVINYGPWDPNLSGRLTNWPKMAQNGPKWPKMTQYGLIWPDLAQCSWHTYL